MRDLTCIQHHSAGLTRSGEHALQLTRSWRKLHAKPLLVVLLSLSLAGMFGGCYSFRGSSVPPHLHTVSLANVVDNSNFGSSVYKDLCSQLLTDRLRAEGALKFVDKEGDAKIIATLTDIRDEAISVKSGEVERERKVRVSVEAEYYDAVKKRQIFKKSFSNTGIFVVANASTERDRAIRTALQQDVDDILLAVISGW